ncbi:MAG: DUF4364 family protein [Clostridia bacterium]|jgi:hypothetical protein|nr:DUF4364 family protein [Clostridia bacterium]
MLTVKGDSFVNKLILLFVFDKMEVPLSESTLLDMCSLSNGWINYMDCKPLLSAMLDNAFIYNVTASGDPLYSITPDGRSCLADFYVQIPSSLREEISKFVKNNRTKYRKRQECVADYYMNKDGTYTVYLKIIEPSQPLMELKLVVPNRQTAKTIYRTWEEKAESAYATIYESIVD